jgi:hypothetical protein
MKIHAGKTGKWYDFPLSFSTAKRGKAYCDRSRDVIKYKIPGKTLQQRR